MDENEDFFVELSTGDDDDDGLHLRRTCAHLFNKNNFVDVTISCIDGQVQAHRMVLSSASSYLYNLFVSTPWPTPCSHPLIILRTSTVADVRSSLEFIYSGKTKTSKNKLLALMEIGRELGLSTLLKSIEKSIQSCGVEMFRRMSANSSQETPRNLSPTSSDTQNQNGPTNDILIKEEQVEYNTGCDDAPRKSNEAIKRISPNSPNASSDSKIARFSNNGEKNYNHSPQIKDGHLKQGANMNGKSDGQDNMTINNSNSSSVQLQHDKGESFVYTSEDLGMVICTKEEEDEEDQNETDDDHDNQMFIPEQSMTIPNGISVLPVSSIGQNQNGGVHSSNSNQVEFKQEPDYEDGVPASCPWCLQVFTSLTLLQRHIKSHVGNYRPFTCEFCQSTFARSAHLKRHLRTHTGEKPYQCSICQRPFARQDKLKVHLERHLQNPVKNGNSTMTITSYPPPSMSQSSGGQCPIKILIPAGHRGSDRRGTSIPPRLSPDESGKLNPTSTPGQVSPLSLQKSRTSMTLTSRTLRSPLFSAKNGTRDTSPSPPTITPISNMIPNQSRIGKSAKSFLTK